jgi:hypothetical protein
LSILGEIAIKIDAANCGYFVSAQLEQLIHGCALVLIQIADFRALVDCMVHQLCNSKLKMQILKKMFDFVKNF